MLKLLRGVACCSVSYAPAQYLARYTGGQSAWTGGVAGDDEREELGQEVSDYELEGEEDDQPDEMTVDTSRLCGTHSTRTVRPTGTCRAPATVAAGWVCVRSADGTTTALQRRPGKEGPARVPRNRRPLPLPRPEQLRVEGSPLSRGRRDHCADSKTS